MPKTLLFPLTPAQFAQKSQELALQGVTISGNAGEVNAKGCTLAYTYDGRLLAVTILKHPPFCEGKVTKKLTEWFKEQA